MAREAFIKLKCICERKDICYFMDLLCTEGWTIYNENGNMEYLPLGDDEDFGWQEEKASSEILKEIIQMKQQQNEFIGIRLFYKESPYGISILARSMDEVVISIDVNRKTVGTARNSLTDFEWYFSTIIMILHKVDSLVFSYKFEDYID